MELYSLVAVSITKAVFSTLCKHGFGDEYLAKHLMGACSDGASVMLGNNAIVADVSVTNILTLSFH